MSSNQATQSIHSALFCSCLILTGKSLFASSSWQSLSPSQGRWDTESLQTGAHLAVGSHFGGERPEEFERNLNHLRGLIQRRKLISDALIWLFSSRHELTTAGEGESRHPMRALILCDKSRKLCWNCHHTQICTTHTRCTHALDNAPFVLEIAGSVGATICCG